MEGRAPVGIHEHRPGDPIAAMQWTVCFLKRSGGDKGSRLLFLESWMMENSCVTSYLRYS
jgi:hypothetical protein